MLLIMHPRPLLLAVGLTLAASGVARAEPPARQADAIDEKAWSPIPCRAGSIEVDRRLKKGWETAYCLPMMVWCRAGAKRSDELVKALERLRDPRDGFRVEARGDKKRYTRYDRIRYMLRASRDAYVTILWVGPDGSVFLPFVNVKVAAGREHRVDPRNIIVAPYGRERWWIIATATPQVWPCRAADRAFVRALGKIVDRGGYAVGRWSTTSSPAAR